MADPNSSDQFDLTNVNPDPITPRTPGVSKVANVTVTKGPGNTPITPSNPNINQNVDPNIQSTDPDIDAKDNNNENSIYSMCEGISAMDKISCISLQAEGSIISPSLCYLREIPSYIPPLNTTFNTDTIISSLYNSIGIFKGKQKRINSFTKMILTTTKSQRQNIKNHYELKYKTPLHRVIARYFKGILRELLLFLIMSENEFIVKWIEVSLKKKDVNLLTLIICTQNNKKLAEIGKIFNLKHKKTMKSKINGLTSNIFHKRNINKFLLNLLNGTRMNDNDINDVNDIINQDQVQNDVNILLNASKSKSTLNKTAWIDIFTSRSFQHIYYVSKHYKIKQNNQKSLIDMVKLLFKDSSETGYAIQVILYYSTRRYELFCDLLAKSINNPGPNYVLFLRLIVERYNKDLAIIIEKYGKNALKSWINLNIKQKDKDSANLIAKLCGL